MKSKFASPLRTKAIVRVLRGGVGRAMLRFQGRFLLILQPLDLAAQFVHRLAPESLAHDFGCGVESVFFAQCNGLGQLVQLRVGQVFDRA